MPQLLASLFLRHEPAPIDYNRAMVALTESSLICSDLLRAHPRERGTILATKAEPIVPSLFPQQTATDTQCLQGESLCFTASLHPTHQSNQQYSILSLSDSSGSVVERISYTAYGQPTFTNAAGTTLSSSAKATRYSYTGREWDPSLQLHHFRARWMSGASGRFLGRDRIGYLGGMNLANFVDSHPLTSLDPIGLIGVRPGHQQHHFFPNGNGLRSLIEGLCSDFSIDEFTMEVQGGTNQIGSEHWYWQYGPCGNYNQDVLEIFHRSLGSCCSFMTSMIEYTERSKVEEGKAEKE